MIRFFFHGQPVHDWLMEQGPTSEESKPAKVIYGGFGVIWNWKDQYFVRSITPVRLGTICVVSGTDVELRFKAPNGSGKPVIVIPRPFLNI